MPEYAVAMQFIMAPRAYIAHFIKQLTPESDARAVLDATTLAALTYLKSQKIAEHAEGCNE